MESSWLYSKYMAQRRLRWVALPCLAGTRLPLANSLSPAQGKEAEFWSLFHWLRWLDLLAHRHLWQ